MRWIVTGGAGFIGSHFVRTALQQGWAEHVTVLDALTYAGNLGTLASVLSDERLKFCRCDIRDPAQVTSYLGDEKSNSYEAVFHFAAESHVDRSIHSAQAFASTNVVGTQVMLDVARRYGVGRFVHVSTDEVYGALPLDAPIRFTEEMPLKPTSPYAASKAGADHLVLAAHRTHALNAVVTRCSNNYGPFQFPEKFIPLFITNGLEGKPLPLYGDGRYVRDWIHVDDHVAGLKLAFERGKAGSVYNLGGNCERPNRAIAEAIVECLKLPADAIQTVTDRPAHDRRYAVDATLAECELGFNIGPPIEARLPELVAWYQGHRGWWEAIKAVPPAHPPQQAAPADSVSASASAPASGALAAAS